MPRLPNPMLVELGVDYSHVRFRDPWEFTESRTPKWATDAVEDAQVGAKVRTGKRKDGDGWIIRSVRSPSRS